MKSIKSIVFISKIWAKKKQFIHFLLFKNWRGGDVV